MWQFLMLRKGKRHSILFDVQSNLVSTDAEGAYVRINGVSVLSGLNLLLEKI